MLASVSCPVASYFLKGPMVDIVYTRLHCTTYCLDSTKCYCMAVYEVLLVVYVIDKA